MVESNVVSLIVIWSFIMVIVIIVGIIVLLWNKMIDEHKQENDNKDRALELEKAKMEYNIRLYEANLKAKQEAKPEVKDPEKASESDLKVWFDIMTDPDKLFGDETTKEVK